MPAIVCTGRGDRHYLNLVLVQLHCAGALVRGTEI